MARILLIDDDPIYLQLFSVYLHRGHHEAETLSDGSKVIDTIRRFKPDIVVTDLMMPGVSGDMVYSLIRREVGESFPVIICSIKKNVKLNFVEDEYARFCSKPIIQRDFLRVIRQLLLAKRESEEEHEGETGEDEAPVKEELNLPFGHFVLKNKIGGGAWGEVYRAMDGVLNRLVAIKLIHNKLKSDAEAVQRFLSEAQTQAQINHPSVVAIYSSGVLDGTHYIAMEYIEGSTLAEAIKRKDLFGPHLALDIVNSIAGALSQCHERGIVHRDLKPANILLDVQGRVKLIDFGVARHKAQGGERATRVGQVVGTPSYMAPEQLNNEELDQRADIFSLCTILFELLTGDLPWDGKNYNEIIHNKLTQPPKSIESFDVHLTNRIQRLIRKGLSVSPDDRFVTLDAFCAELHACILESSSAARGYVPDFVDLANLTMMKRQMPLKSKRKNLGLKKGE